MRLWVLALVGCGRLQFDPSNSDAGGNGDAPILVDAPPLPPSLVCDATRVPMTVATNTDLVVGRRITGMVAMWAAPNDNVHMMEIDAGFVAGAARALATGPVDRVAGVMATSMTTLLVTQTGAEQSLWTVNADATLVVRETSIAGREPLFTDDSTVGRAWMRGTPSGLRLAYVSDTGVVDVDNTIPTPSPVIALSAASNDDHLHASWSEDLGTGTRCMQADIDLGPLYPIEGGSSFVDDDCDQRRNDSGPDDSILNVYRAADGRVAVRYLGAVANQSLTLATTGRAPRVRYDGTRFWVAWIGGDDVVRVATLASGDLAMEEVALPGWTPVGDEAFELVATSSGVVLAMLQTDSLTLLTTCP